MFERFTVRARNVVVDAQASARRLGHGYTGTEHVLLALLEVENGAGPLTSLGLSKAAVDDFIAGD